MPRISTDNYDTVASWNGSQDLFVVEQPDGTKVATPALLKQYVLGNSIDDIYSVMGQMGAKNLIPYPYYEQTHTENGITFTDNGDGTITANGTATDTAIFGVVLGNTALSANGNLTINTNKPLILSGCPSGGGNNTYRIQYGLTDGTSYWAKTASDTGSGVELTPVDGLNSYCFDVIRIMVFKGCTVNNLTFKPMLRLASDTDNTYQPYAKTNKQLTEVIGDLSQTGLTGDSVSEQLSTAGEQIADVVANRALLPIVNDSTVLSATPFDMGSSNGVYLVIVGQGGSANLLGLYLVKITHYAAGTNVATIVTPTQNPPTVTATEITSSQGGKITITPNGLSIHAAIYKFILNMA